MKTSKAQLLTAAAVTALCGANSAQAGIVVYPVAELRGNGASTISNVAVKVDNCLGTDTPKGISVGTTEAVPLHNYQPATPTVGNPNYDCATKTVQPNLSFYYVSTGSGAGKSNWRNFNVASIGTNPFGAWGHIQYAFSESGLVASDLTSYNTNAAPNGVGAPIQIPMYTVPVALAYKSVYGRIDNGSGPVDLTFNLKYPLKDGAGNPVGGLRLKKTTYCAILNGTITNWNDNAIKVDNGGQSLMDPNDNTTLWNSTGVPIKLVGRNDNSGGTNIFTRHLSAVCPGTDFAGLGGTDQLPAARKGTAIYDTTTGALTSGAETLGKFGRVTDSAGIAVVVDLPIATPSGPGDRTVGGYLGYVGADFTKPSPGRTLFNAALQVGTTTTYALPTAKNAVLSFGTTFLPPQSAKTGKYDPAVTTTGAASHLRTDPLAWVLEPNATTGLANPTKGYPMVGTANALLYTCYDTTAKRSAISVWAALHHGKVTFDSVGGKVPAKLVTGTANDINGIPIGVLAQNGIAPLPTAWINAIRETFFTKVTTGNNPSSLNLWIQDKLPTTTAGIAALQSNSTCTLGSGA